MNKGFVKALLCVAMLIALDFAVGTCMKKLYFAPKEGKYYDQTYALDIAKADVIILGSSRATHGYITQRIEDSLHLTCYNASREGAHFLHQYAVFRSITKRYHPKLIIWDYWEGLKKSDLDYLELGTLAPYYKTHPEIKQILDLKGPYEKIKMLSQIYPYNSSLIYNLNKACHFWKNSEKDQSIKGYVPLKRVWDEKLKVDYINPNRNPLDTNCINMYKAAIAFCKKNNIQLVFVVSPFFNLYKYSPNYDVKAEQIANDEHVPFFNMIRDSTILSSNKNFAETIHLNITGAQIFTDELIRKLKTNKNIRL